MTRILVLLILKSKNILQENVKSVQLFRNFASGGFRHPDPLPPGLHCFRPPQTPGSANFLENS